MSSEKKSVNSFYAKTYKAKKKTERKEFNFYMTDDRERDLYDFMMSQPTAKGAVIKGLELLKNKIESNK